MVFMGSECNGGIKKTLGIMFYYPKAHARAYTVFLWTL